MGMNTSPSAIPDFGHPYDKARRGYGLASALLLAWELIGIEVSAQPFDSLHLTFKSPAAAPYVLIVLVIYFGFRLTVEWYQAETARRQRLASRADCFVAHAIAGLAVGVYVIQAMLNVQLANEVRAGALAYFVLGILVHMLGSVVLTTLGTAISAQARVRESLFTASVLMFVFFLFLVYSPFPHSFGLAATGFALSGFLSTHVFLSALGWFLFRQNRYPNIAWSWWRGWIAKKGTDPFARQ